MIISIEKVIEVEIIDFFIQMPERFIRCLVAGERSFPPEDCGSTPGYEECLDAVKYRRNTADFRNNLTPDTDSECPFCSPTVDNRIVDEHESIAAVEDGYPVTKGHLLIIPKRHTSDFFSMTSQERDHAVSFLRVLKNRISEEDRSVRSVKVDDYYHKTSGVSIGVRSNYISV